MPIQRITPEADERVKRRALLAVFITIFVSLIGFGIVIPLLPFYAQRFQASELQIGLLFASFSVAQLFASPILGDWSDRWGRRPVLILSLLGSAASFVMLALAPNLFWLFLSRLLDGFTGGNITTARAYIADISPPERRARNFGLIGAAFGLGFILGPALGGGLASFGLAVPAWAAAAISLLAAAYAFVALPETAHLVPAKRPSPWREMPTTLTRSPAARLLWMNFILWLGFSVYQTTFPLFVAMRFGLGPREIGYILAVVGLVGALSQARWSGAWCMRWASNARCWSGCC
jgi:DHA1 family tetracycline resistance protein-like MFS transporter